MWRTTQTLPLRKQIKICTHLAWWYTSLISVDAEAGRPLWVPNQPELHSDTFSDQHPHPKCTQRWRLEMRGALKHVINALIVLRRWRLFLTLIIKKASGARSAAHPAFWIPWCCVLVLCEPGMVHVCNPSYRVSSKSAWDGGDLLWDGEGSAKYWELWLVLDYSHISALCLVCGFLLFFQVHTYHFFFFVLRQA